MRQVIKVVDYREIIKISDTKNGLYVLAYLPNKDEWVTWATDKEVENFYWGHYFKDRDSAEKDFLTRGED